MGRRLQDVDDRQGLLTRTINDNNASRFGRDLVCSLPSDTLCRFGIAGTARSTH
jgi:hypothetical protein